MKDPETNPLARPDYAPPAGLGMGYLRLEAQKDKIDLVCRLCGRELGEEVWAEALSDGRGGLAFIAPICFTCMTRGGESRATEPERARRLAALVAKLADLRPKPRARPRLRRKRPAAPSERAEEGPGRSEG